MKRKKEENKRKMRGALGGKSRLSNMKLIEVLEWEMRINQKEVMYWINNKRTFPILTEMSKRNEFPDWKHLLSTQVIKLKKKN